MKPPTQQTIAELCGVSRATVGAILAGDERSALFHEATRRKVLETAAALHYRPHRGAQMMRARRSRLVAVIAFGASYEVGRRAAAALPPALTAQGYDFRVFDCQWHGRYLEGVLHEIIQHRFAGVILVGLPHAMFTPEHAAFLQENRVPVVALEGDQLGSEISASEGDSAIAFRQLVEHLFALGHRELFLLVSGSDDSRAFRERIAGFTQGLEAHGAIKEEWREADFFQRWPWPAAPERRGSVVILEKEGDVTRQSYRFAQRLFASGRLPDAILSSNDSRAFGLFHAARETGLSIPGDLAITGYDDDAQGAYPAYGLTTARQEIELECAAAVELLLQQIANPQAPPQRRRFAPRLVIRTSCGGGG